MARTETIIETRPRPAGAAAIRLVYSAPQVGEMPAVLAFEASPESHADRVVTTYLEVDEARHLEAELHKALEAIEKGNLYDPGQFVPAAA
jgi:hypothetical protein